MSWRFGFASPCGQTAALLFVIGGFSVPVRRRCLHRFVSRCGDVRRVKRHPDRERIIVYLQRRLLEGSFEVGAMPRVRIVWPCCPRWCLNLVALDYDHS